MQGKKNSWLWNGKESSFQLFRNRKNKTPREMRRSVKKDLIPILVNVSTDAVKHCYQQKVGDERV